jgi:hypothetical protein
MNCPHPLTPSPKMGEGEQEIRLPSPVLGEGLVVRGTNRMRNFLITTQ